MREVVTLATEARERAGKGAARAVRLDGKVPGVVYGAKKPPQLVSLELRVINTELHKGSFFNRLFELEIGGAKERVLARDLQFDPVTDRPTHVDFMRVSDTSRIRIFIPVIFQEIEKSPGIKKGGVLNIVRHEVEFFCKASAIPESIIISLAGAEIGQSFHISHVKLAADVVPVIRDRDFTIATVAAPTTSEAEDKPQAAAAAEGAAEGGDAKAAAPAAGAKAAPAAAKAPAAKAPAGGDKKK